LTAWIALEGGEGCGKSTQAERLARRLGALLTREPGGTALGSSVRALLLDPSTGVVEARAEALLMAADRAQHVASVVSPSLAAGRHVVSDRSAWSSLAYQGYGRGLDVSELWRLSDWAMGGRWPDLAVLVDVPLELAAVRMGGRGRVADRFESEGDGFHARVAAGFRALAAAHAERWAVVDGSGTADEVAARVLAAVQERLGLSVAS
jgi:dTMP kinase